MLKKLLQRWLEIPAATSTPKKRIVAALFPNGEKKDD